MTKMIKDMTHQQPEDLNPFASHKTHSYPALTGALEPIRSLKLFRSNSLSGHRTYIIFYGKKVKKKKTLLQIF